MLSKYVCIMILLAIQIISYKSVKVCCFIIQVVGRESKQLTSCVVLALLKAHLLK